MTDVQVFHTAPAPIPGQRKSPLRPLTFDESSRSVRVVAVTESPIQRVDPFTRRVVDMILFVDGVILPPTGQVPLLDSHRITTVLAVLGSARNFQVLGNTLECDVFFSGTPAGVDTAQKVKEGHVTDFSVGFIWYVKDTELVPSGQTRTIQGRNIHGPARVIKKWRLLELSVAVVGADEKAKARTETALVETSAQETRAVRTNASFGAIIKHLLWRLFLKMLPYIFVFFFLWFLIALIW